jgi:hypothetical protein
LLGAAERQVRWAIIMINNTLLEKQLISWSKRKLHYYLLMQSLCYIKLEEYDLAKNKLLEAIERGLYELNDPQKLLLLQKNLFIDNLFLLGKFNILNDIEDRLSIIIDNNSKSISRVLN